MPGQTIKIAASAGGEFDCYLALPAANEPVPAIVLACAAHGVDKDIRDLTDEFAAHGYIAVAPDLFWRSVPSALPLSEARAREHAQPRLEKIKAGEADMTDTLAALRPLGQFNGRAAVIGFCYGGPYAIIRPKRLGYAAGISWHGTRMLDVIVEFDGVGAPVCIIWGDQDHQAPAEVLEAYRAVPARTSHVEVHIFSGIQHGYMMRDAGDAFDQGTRDFSIARALAILNDLRGSEQAMRRAS